MSLIPIGSARRLAKEQLQSCLRTYLSAELVTSRALSTYTPDPPLPAPASDNIYLTDPEDPAKLDRNASVFLYVFESGPRVVDTTYSGGGSTLKKKTSQDFKIVMLFRYELSDQCSDPDGIIPESDELLKHRGELYLDGLINTVFKRAKKSTAIHDAELIGDQQYPPLYKDGMISMGMVVTTWRITQMCSAPDSICS